MTFSARAIAALQSAKHTAPNHPRGVGFNEGLDSAIAILRALAAEGPTQDDIALIARFMGLYPVDAAWRAAVGGG